MRVTVRIMAALGGGRTEEVELPDDGLPTIAQVLDALVTRRPGLAERLRTPQGGLPRFVNVFVDSQNVKALGGLDAPVPAGVEVWVIPPGSGG